jgi:parvulin-like peptidyl-prolyl isomerase
LAFEQTLVTGLPDSVFPGIICEIVREIDKTVKCGTMVLDIVGSSVQDTIGRVLRCMVKTRIQAACLVALSLALLLAACGAGGDAPQPASPGEPPVVVVATVALAEGSPTPAPTVADTTVPPTSTPPAPLAALVNGQYIFLAEYEKRVAQYEQALLQQGVDLNTDEGHAYLAQARQDVLDGLIDGALIEQGAAALGISLAEDELEGQVEADIAAGGGQAAFEEWLQSTGQTREDYKEMLRQSLLAQRVLDSVSADVGADAEQVHVRLIMVDSEEAAQQILALLQQGGDFAALVREHSLDLATKENGGDLGWFPRGLVAPELETAAFSLQPGQVSGVVRLGDGYHIIQVIEREAARPLSPELQLDLKLSFFEEWLAGQRASALIERYVGE